MSMEHANACDVDSRSSADASIATLLLMHASAVVDRPPDTLDTTLCTTLWALAAMRSHAAALHLAHYRR